MPIRQMRKPEAPACSECGTASRSPHTQEKPGPGCSASSSPAHRPQFPLVGRRGGDVEGLCLTWRASGGRVHGDRVARSSVSSRRRWRTPWSGARPWLFHAIPLAWIGPGEVQPGRAGVSQLPLPLPVPGLSAGATGYVSIAWTVEPLAPCRAEGRGVCLASGPQAGGPLPSPSSCAPPGLPCLFCVWPKRGMWAGRCPM